MYIQTMTERIQQLRYQMLVHSYLYYQLGENIISDHEFDRRAMELVACQERYPKESRQARYYDGFKDFTGSTGFDLPYSMPNIQAIGDRILRYHKEEIVNGNAI